MPRQSRVLDPPGSEPLCEVSTVCLNPKVAGKPGLALLAAWLESKRRRHILPYPTSFRQP
jgi:hypothetical protein